MSSYGVVLFDSTQAALRAEKVLEKAGFPIKLIPVPRQFSADCGLSVRFPFEQAEDVRAALESAGVPFSALHHL